MRTTPQEAVAIITAFAEGKAIEYRNPTRPWPWHPVVAGSPWYFDIYEYRVKPVQKVPRRIFVNLWPNGTDSIYNTEREALCASLRGMRPVEFVEVIKE